MTMNFAASSLQARLEAYRASHVPRAVSTTQGTFEYAIGGSGHRTVLILHGGGSIAEASHPFALALEPDLRVIAVDWPATVHRVDDLVRGFIAVLDAERVEQVGVLGFSMGGMLGQCLARAQPGRIDKLVLYVSMGPSHRYARRFRRYRRYLRWIPASWLERASKRAVTKWVTETAQLDRADEIAFVARHRRWMFDSGKVSKRSLVADAAVLVDFFSRSFASGDLRAVDVLIIEAHRDRMVDAEERAHLKRLYPRAKVITLVDEEHFAGLLAPSSVMAPIREHLLR